MEYPSTTAPVSHDGIFYLPSVSAKPEVDLIKDGKQFISSLAAKRDTTPSSIQQKPIAPPNKNNSPSPAPPLPGLPPGPTQPHAFVLNASLLPQTFSVHLLSTLHMGFQHVSAALEMLDLCFANEISRTGATRPPVSTRWETWMSQAGTAGMTRALTELRKSLDELCGITARAGWIVDTWGAYQHGMLDGCKQTELNLGSAAINGVEIGAEAEKKGVHAPIGRPSLGARKTLVSPLGKVEAPDRKGASSLSNDTISALSNVGILRPPPGLAIPTSPPTVSRQPSMHLANGRKYFSFDPAKTAFREATTGEMAKLINVVDIDGTKRPDIPMLK